MKRRIFIYSYLDDVYTYSEFRGVESNPYSNLESVISYLQGYYPDYILDYRFVHLNRGFYDNK